MTNWPSPLTTSYNWNLKNRIRSLYYFKKKLTSPLHTLLLQFSFNSYIFQTLRIIYEFIYACIPCPQILLWTRRLYWPSVVIHLQSIPSFWLTIVGTLFVRVLSHQVPNSTSYNVIKLYSSLVFPLILPFGSFQSFFFLRLLKTQRYWGDFLYEVPPLSDVCVVYDY